MAERMAKRITEPMAGPMATAVAALESFLCAWKNENWRMMTEVCQLTWMSNHEDALAFLTARYGPIRLVSWEVEEVVEPPDLVKGVVVDVTVALRFLNILKDGMYTYRIICEVGPYHANPEGTWGVNPISQRRR